MSPLRRRLNSMWRTNGIYKRRECYYKDIEQRMQSFKELHLLVVIVSRSDGDKVTSILRTKHMPGHYVFYAEGTASSSLLDLFGLGSSEKEVILGFVIKSMIPPLLEEIDSKLHFTKKGTGMALSVPLTGLIVPPLAHHKRLLEQWQENLEREVDNVNTELTHDLIIIMVDEDHQEEVMEAARSAGAGGGTTFQALHFGMQDMAKFFGIPMQDKKDVVAILAKREDKLKIMDAINDQVGSIKKILFSLPADNVMITSEKKTTDKDK